MKHTIPKLNKPEAAARQQARAEAKADNGKGGNLAKLAARIDRLEKIVGIVPAK